MVTTIEAGTATTSSRTKSRRDRIEHGRDDAQHDHDRERHARPSAARRHRDRRATGSRSSLAWTRAASPTGRTSAGRAPTVEAIPPEIGIDMTRILCRGRRT